jgi:SAM-dependent methyltransferase
MSRDYGAEVAELKAVPFQLQSLVDLLSSWEWEPAAAATLLMIIGKNFGYRELETAITARASESRVRAIIEQEWKRRAELPGLRAVMSSRLSSAIIESVSDSYVSSFMGFISDAIDDATVLEIGSGIGRFSKLIASRSARLTCLDLNGRMHERNRQHLGDLVDRVEYVQSMVQDYVPPVAFDVGISSQVLCHCVTSDMFTQATAVFGRGCNTIFLAETVDSKDSLSPHTRQMSIEDLVTAFPNHAVSKLDHYLLGSDKIAFLRLDRVTGE